MFSNPKAENKNAFTRKHKRLLAMLDVEIQHLKPYSSQSVNISEEGVCFDLPHRFPVGREVALRIHVSDDRRQAILQSRCRIVWQQQPENQNIFRHGGKFLFFLDDGEKQLKEFLQAK